LPCREDVIKVQEGTYRELDNPEYGWANGLKWIDYQAATEEVAIVKGSEVIKN